MNLYFIRHGDAEKSSHTIRDFDRALTEKGKERMKRAAEGWSGLVGSFNYIISSPLLRARQTAEVLKEVFLFKDEVLIDNKITSGSKIEEVIELANSLNGNDIALVGHMPDFAYHVSCLISASGATVDFSPGTIAKVSFHGKVKLSRGTLEWLIPVKAFQKEEEFVRDPF